MICTAVFKQINLIIMKKENYVFDLKQNLKIIFLGIVLISLIIFLDQTLIALDMPLPLTNSTPLVG